MTPKFFKSAKEFRKWLEKNHDREKEIWVGFYKKHAGPTLLSKDAVDQAICFGWAYGVLRGIDHLSYVIRFTPRRPKSAFSVTTLKRARELEKLGLMHEAGKKAVANRKKDLSEKRDVEFSPAILKRFKANKKAWAFFEKQTPSYRRYMILWVMQAKREETREKRVEMLIADSARESKLARVVEASEKIKKRFAPGQTPIEEARNLGPVSGGELRSLGIETVEQLKAMGWEKAFHRLCELYPHRANMNMLKSLIGAVDDVDWRKLDSEQKAEAKAVLSAIDDGSRR